MQIDSLLGRGAESCVYSLKKPHHDKVVKILNGNSSIESEVYDALSTLDTTRRRWFCKRWKSPDSSMLVLSRCHPVEWSRLPVVAACLRDITESIRVLHSLGILHHDVHPQNMMRDPRHQRYVLLDFGLATIRSNNVVDQLYMLTREDHFSFLNHVVVQKYPRCRILHDDYRRARKRWSAFFSRHPEKWSIFRRHFRSSFPQSLRSPCTAFLQKILEVDRPFACRDRESKLCSLVSIFFSASATPCPRRTARFSFLF